MRLRPFAVRGLTLAAGDVCLYVCCDRDITLAVEGKQALPVKRHHSLSDTVIVGVIG